MIDVKELMYFNFMTTRSDEVNWYLRRWVGCNKCSDSGFNWKFSNSAHPGIIYIPPAEHDPIRAGGRCPDQELYSQERRHPRTLSGFSGGGPGRQGRGRGS